MSVTLINPDELAEPAGFAQVAVATGSKFISVAGQVGMDADGKLVGDDLATQTQQAVKNVVTALSAADASYADVVNVTMYLPDWHESKMDALVAGFRAAATELGIDAIKPGALVGVARLGQPEWLIELAVTAIV